MFRRAILTAQYRRICQNRLKTYVISRFVVKILPVPISLNSLEIYISNYLLSVMNDVIFKIDFPKSSLSTLILLALVEYLILRILVTYFIRIYCETPYTVQKLFDIWRHSERLRVFFIFWTKKLISVHMSPNVPISPNLPISP